MSKVEKLKEMVLSWLVNVIYHLWEIKYWIRERWFKIRKIDRDFTCQSQAELESKCKFQCDHCKSYYKVLDEKWTE